MFLFGAVEQLSPFSTVWGPIIWSFLRLSTEVCLFSQDHIWFNQVGESPFFSSINFDKVRDTARVWNHRESNSRIQVPNCESTSGVVTYTHTHTHTHTHTQILFLWNIIFTFYYTRVRPRFLHSRAGTPAIDFFFPWFWIRTASAPSTAGTSTGGGAVVRKPGSTWLEGTPANGPWDKWQTHTHEVK